MWVPLVDAQQLLVQAPLYLIWFIFNNISTTTTIIVIFISIYISWASPKNRQKRYYLPWPRYEPGSKSSGTGSHSGGISGTEMGWVIRIRSNSWIKSTLNKYKKICRNVFITSSSELSPISFQASNHLQDCTYCLLTWCYNHTWYLSFFYTSKFWSLEILHSKVRKFATKIASRQNSVN